MVRSHGVATALVVVLAVCACRGGDPDGPLLPPALSACTSDDDCVHAPDCCPGCGDLTAPFDMVTRTEAELARAACSPFRECPHVDCVSPPPCHADVAPACVAGRCTVRLTSVELRDGDVGACACESCGPPPDLTVEDGCTGYRQIMYEHCCCRASGVASCTLDRWHGAREACAQRDRCRDAAAIAAAPALDGCDPDAPAPPLSTPEHARAWTGRARTAPGGKPYLVVWSANGGLAFVDPATGGRSGVAIRGSGAPSSPSPQPTSDGRALVLSGYGAIAFVRPEPDAYLSVVKSIGVARTSLEVKGVSDDLATLLVYEAAHEGGPRWALVRYDQGRAIVPGWTSEAVVAPAGFDGALAPDGGDAIVETGCAPTTPPAECPRALVRLSASGTITPLPIADVRGPRWLSNDAVLVSDPEGPRIVALARATLEARTFRDKAWSPAVGGGRVFFLEAGASCTGDATALVNCPRARVMSSDLAGGDVRVALADEAWFIARDGPSPDGAWLVIATRGPDERAVSRVCALGAAAGGSAGACRELGAGVWARGWVR